MPAPDPRSLRGVALRAAVERVAAIDHHAHLLAAPGTPISLAEALTESRSPEQVARTADHPAYQRAVRDLAHLGGAERAADRMLASCGLAAMLVDDGYTFPGALSLADHAALVGLPVRRILRIEAIAEASAAGWPPFASVQAAFRAAIDDALGTGAVALKTIAAYRCGLDLPPADDVAAADAYEQWRATGRERLVAAPLVAWFVDAALDVARARGVPVPLQVHTGIGDADLDLARAAPELLQPRFDAGWADVPIVLLHTYPFVREASWLAHVYPNVHLDVSLAITLVGHRGADVVLDALALAPASKLLFGTDASRIPELFLLGTRWWRDALAGALDRLLDDDVIDDATALRWAELVLAGNARVLYGLDDSI